MNILYRIIRKNAVGSSNKTAIIDRRGSVTYGELWNRICFAAEVLRRNGLKKGGKVVISADSSIDFAVIFIAIQAAGGVSVPIDRAMRGETAAQMILTADAELFITLSRNKKSVQTSAKVFSYADVIGECAGGEVPFTDSELDLDDTAEIIFTTGTTGKPKGAIHTYRSISANMQMTFEGVGIRENDVILIPVALSHSYGLRVLRSSLFAGATVVLQNGALFFDELERNLRKNFCTGLAYITVGIEMMFSQLGEERVRDILGGLRYIEFSAGALPLNMRKKLCSLLPSTDILNTWGSTETGGALFINISQDRNKASAGKTMNGAEARLVSLDGKSFADGQSSGRLALCGDMVMSGYIGEPALTKASFLEDYLVTGDVVSINSDGYVFFEGRTDDIINCGGEKIAPAEVEHIALNCGGIEEAVCVGVKDKEGFFGEIPIIFIKPVSNEAFSVENLKKHFANTLVRTKIPREIIVTNNIPHNSMGKVERKKLIASYESRSIELANPVIQAILNRRSVRDFTEEEISSEVINKLVEAGTAAPSGRNTRTRIFVVLSDRNEIHSLKALVGKVAAREKTSFHGFNNPPLMILIANERRNRDGIQDSACAAENIMLACHSLGLGSVWLNSLMNICDTPEIRARLDSYGIPSSYIVWAALAIGFPAGRITDFVRKKEKVIYIGGKTDGNK